MTTLTIENATVRRGDVAVLNRVSATFAGGAFVGVLGPNGAGKSTLLRALAGLERPEEGRVLIDGVDLGGLRPRERARRIAFLPQSRPIYAAIDVETVVALGRFAYGAPRRLDNANRAAVDRAMAETGVAALARRRASTLSGGELARAHLARLFASETPVVVADEPAAALDPKRQLTVMQTLAARAAAGAVVVVALHEVILARRFCSHLLLMRAGRIVAFGPPETLTDDLARLFELDPLDALLAGPALKTT